MDKEKAELKAEYRTPLNLHNLPTSKEKLSVGDVWNNEGVLNIVSK